MKWNDSLDIAIALAEAHPDIDPRSVRYTDMHAWICALPDLTTSRRRPTSGFWRQSKWHGWTKPTDPPYQSTLFFFHLESF